MRWQNMLGLAAGACLLAGCQTLSDSWKTVRSYHHEYLNTPAVVDKTSVPAQSDAETVLCDSMVPVEQRLVPFERALFAMDTAPDMEWIAAFLQRFPWVNGIAVVNPEGIVMQQYPESSLKPLDFSLVAGAESKTTRRLLKAAAQETPLGPEVYVAAPLMHNAELVGYVVAHFDPRALISLSPLAGDVVVQTPHVLLWPGRYRYSATPLAGADWEALMQGHYRGVVGSGEASFAWIARYLGSLPLIFAAPLSGDFEEEPGQLDSLRSYIGSGYVLPPAQTPAFTGPETGAVQESDLAD